VSQFVRRITGRCDAISVRFAHISDGNARVTVVDRSFTTSEDHISRRVGHWNQRIRDVSLFADRVTEFDDDITRVFHSITLFVDRASDTLRRVHGFLEANDSLFGRISKADLPFELGDVVTKLGAGAGDPAGGRVTEVVRQSSAADARESTRYPG
jgi:hypothetical protein